jgi:hypothetical protein
MALPEIDNYEYTGLKPRDGRSYVCSSFIVSMFKAAGIFGNLEINP